MIALKHHDGVSELKRDYVRAWFKTRMKRLQIYFDLGDTERAVTEATILHTALQTGVIAYAHKEIPETPDP
jgi:hypothetical protein